jgi:selenocysteine lyase/cysteine desulfurase
MVNMVLMPSARPPASPVTSSASGSSAATARLDLVKAQFEPVRGYLNAATLGLPPIPVAEAVRDAVSTWQLGKATAISYDEDVKAARAAYAGLVSVPSEWVSVGSQTSVIAGLVASSLPDGAEVVCVEGDFTSVLFPFLVHADRGITVRHVPLSEVALSVTERTALVVFSLVQSACGSVCDGQAITAAAHAVGALTFCDITQAAGWLPIAASDYDLTVCSAYKWLCHPRGTAYLTIRPELIERVRPINAGWYAGEDVWGSCYGPSMHLAHDARRFDVSPAWLSWVGAVPALQVMGMVPTSLIRDHNVALADELRARIGVPAASRPSLASPVVSVEDITGVLAGRLAQRGAVVSLRAGRVRIAFHIWNTRQDVDLVAEALSPVMAQH